MSDELPVRPRRRAVNPASVSLCAVLLVAAGFIGGAEVQKRQGSGSGAANAAARFRGGQFTAGGGAGAASDATVGRVADVHGRTLYVTGSDGTTVKVKTNANTKVTRNAVSKVKRVHPGDTVVVQGAKSASGTVKASRVSATASNAGALGGGGFGGFGATPGGG